LISGQFTSFLHGTPGGKFFKYKRQKYGKVVAFSKNDQLGRTIDWTDKIGQIIGMALQLQAGPVGAETGPVNYDRFRINRRFLRSAVLRITGRANSEKHQQAEQE